MAAHHEPHAAPSETIPGYRKKQAVICVLVFLCIGLAFAIPNLYVALGSIFAACGLCAWAARIQPPPPVEEHHH